MQKIKASGFTLIEILVSLSVVAVALIATSKLLHTYTQHSIQLIDKNAAHWVVQNQINLSKIKGVASTDEGDTAMMHRDWHWQTNIGPTQPGSCQQKVEINVFKKNSNALMDKDTINLQDLSCNKS